MSLKLFFGLGLQCVAVLLVMTRVRRRRLAYTGVLFVSMSVLYHGLTELVQIAFPGMNHYRTLASQDMIDSWVLIVGMAILIFAITYCYRLRPLSITEIETPPPLALGLVNWRWWMLIVVLLQLMVAGIFGRFDLGYWERLITDPLPVFTIFVLAEFLYKMRGRYLLPVVMFQIGLGVLSGSRAAILLDLIVLFSVLLRCGVPIRWRPLFLPGIIALFLAVSISAMRSAVGRESFMAQTNMQRIESLCAGAGEVIQNGLTPDILQDFVYRFDGNTFTGLIVAGYEAGIEPAGWKPILNNFRLVVPRFMNPTKLETGLLNLNAADYIIDHFKISGFRTDKTGELLISLIDYIKGIWEILFGAFGTAGVLLSAALMGWGFAVADNWIVRSKTLLAVFVGFWLTYTTVLMEQGFYVYIITGRAVFVLFLVFVMFRQLKALLTRSCRRISTSSSELCGQSIK